MLQLLTQLKLARRDMRISDPILIQKTNQYRYMEEQEDAGMFFKRIAGQHIVSGSAPVTHLLHKLSRIEKELLQISNHSQTLAGKEKADTAVIAQLINDHAMILQNQINKVNIMLSAMKINLPKLAGTSQPEQLRMHDICNTIIVYTDAKIDLENLTKYIVSYQAVSVLQYDELKAMKAFLLYAILDNLRTVLLTTPCHENDITHCKVIIRNSICSLSIIDTIDWRAFIDSNSSIDCVLQQDSTGIYSNMDFFTRDRYRIEISKLAKQAGVTEASVARSILLLSKRSVAAVANASITDIGEFLIGKERYRLEKFLGIQLPFKERLRNTCKKNSLALYLSFIWVPTILAAVFCMFILHARDIPAWLYCTTCLLLLIALSHAAKQLTDAMALTLNVPQSLPMLDFSKELPAAYTTLVTIPALLTSKHEIERLVHSLKIYFIGNRMDNLYFSLLTDFTDADAAHLPQDAELLKLVMTGINDLNNEFCAGKPPRFFLFHRPRKWNAAAKIWMGHERKRGKLMDLNNLLRNPDNHNFSAVIVDKAILPRIKYVITLDADTQLPRDTAWRLVAVMAHPLNRAVYSKEKGRTIKGYGMLQPKIGTDLRGMNNSLYEHIYGSGPDIDPYTSASADLYQDLFDEGSFTGKGIYDVDIVNEALANRLPENRILSHDLLEGCYVRSGFLSNIKLHERTVNYWVEVKRRERWTRGDWQIASWMFFSVPAFCKGKTRNPLSALSRWKIFDNLRNSLVPVSLLLLVVGGWLVFNAPLGFSLLVLLVVLSPGLCLFAGNLLQTPGKLWNRAYWASALNNSCSRLLQNSYSFICLPYEAAYTVTAITRACWRLLFSGRKRLEWQPSAGSENQDKRTLLSTYRQMWISPFLGIFLLAYLVFSNTSLAFYASPVLLLWLFAPFIAYKINLPRPEKVTTISFQQKQLVQRLSRKTWAYFDDQVTQEVNWLPPDHVQEYPEQKIAYYTSPTNMGLCLLCYLAAFDMGYIPCGDLIQRTARTLHTMQCLERYEGHFFNWYDIKTLNATTPRYVSTVDSGNLAGHLITLRQGLIAIAQHPVFTYRQLSSLTEVINMILLPGDAHDILHECKTYLECFSKETGNAKNIKQAIDRLGIYIGAIAQLLQENIANDDTQYWIHAFIAQAQATIQDLQAAAPWLWLPPAPSSLSHLVPDHTLTLAELANWQPRTETGKNKALQEDEAAWLEQFTACMKKAKVEANKRLQQITSLAELCTRLSAQEYDFLYNPSAHMLSIGYKVEENCQDTECYDMLASEARLATYVAVCRNKLPVKSWFTLGRPLIRKNNMPVLLSANGTMFEYLMPNLVMPVFRNTLLDHACSAAVKEQIEYGREHDIPWGVSESCYALFDDALNYQYRVFGIPLLSLKHHHVAKDRVISPYATALSILIDPEKAGTNLERLAADGAEGRYGLYEAVDYTVSRLQKGQSKNTIQSFMAHHQGMSLLAFTHILLDKPMQKRFMADAEMESGIFLLQEKLPENPVLHNRQLATSITRQYIHKANDQANEATTTFTPASDTHTAEVQLLSNGRYHIALTNNDDCHNCFRFGIQEEEIKQVETFFPEGYAVFRQYGKDTETQTRITVSHDDNVEVRQLTISNKSGKNKKAWIIAQLPYHQSSWQKEDYPEQHIILYYKRPQASHGKCSLHFLGLHIENTGTQQHKVFPENSLLIRYDIDILPGETVTAVMYTGTADTTVHAFELSRLIANPLYVEQLFQRSAMLAHEQLKQMNISKNDARLFRQLTGALLAKEKLFIAGGGIHFERLNTQNRDIVILLRISQVENIEAVVKMIQLHWYWRLNGLAVTVLILNEDRGCYKNFLQKLITETIINSIGAESLNRHGGGIFIKMPEHLTTEDQLLLSSAGCTAPAEVQ